MSVIKVKLFSHLKYALTCDAIEIELSADDTTRELEEKIRLKGGSDIVSMPFRIALNHEFVSEPKKIHQDDEIALIPPVQGG